VIVLIESFGRQICRADIPATQLAAGSGNEIVDTLLGLDSLVKVVMPGEDHAYAKLHKQRLQHSPELLVGTVTAAGGIERMVEVENFPLAT